MNNLWNAVVFCFSFLIAFWLFFSGTFPESEKRESKLCFETGEKIIHLMHHFAIVEIVMSSFENALGGRKLVKSIVKGAGAVDGVCVLTVVIVVVCGRDSLTIDGWSAGASGWGEAGAWREFHALYRTDGEWHEKDFWKHFKF